MTMAGHYETSLNRKLTKAMMNLNKATETMTEVMVELHNNGVSNARLNSLQDALSTVEDRMYRWMLDKEEQYKLIQQYYKGRKRT